MKRTEIERIERELKRVEKREKKAQLREPGDVTPGAYIERLFSLYRYDMNEIFNTQTDEDILEVLEELKENLPEKKQMDVLRKSIKRTGVKQRDRAYEELVSLMSS